MVSLVENAIAEEELCSKSSQKLFVIDGCTLGVFLSFQVPLHLMIPGFLGYLFGLKIAAVYWLGNFQIMIRGASLSHLTLNMEDIVANASAN